jgi:hypothetical protein
VNKCTLILCVVGLLVSLNLIACGTGVADEEYPVDPLSVISGQITAAGLENEINSEIRVALFWVGNLFEIGPEDDLFQFIFSAQEVGVSSEFPASFQLKIYDLPPEQAMNRFDDEEGMGIAMATAFGSIVVYADDNGNGKLDFPTSIDAPLIDRILSTDDNLSVFYVEDLPELIDGLSGMPSNGFNLVDFGEVLQATQNCMETNMDDISTDPFLDCLMQLAYQIKYSPIDTPIEIPLSTTDAGLPLFLCATIVNQAIEQGQEFYTAECDPDGRGATLHLNDLPVLNLCSYFDGMHYELSPDEAPGEDWPCN